MIKNISLINKIEKITRFLGYQHNIFYSLLPLIYFKSNFIDILIIYFIFLFFCMFAFMSNDYADADNDKIARKNSIFLGLISKNNLLILSLICLIISYIISLYFYSVKAFLFLLFMTFLSYTYSFEPFRLKKKSILGFPIVVFAAGPAGLIYSFIAYGFVDYFWLIIMGIISFLHIGQTQIWGGLNDFEADSIIGMHNRIEQKLGKKKTFILLTWLERVLFSTLLITFLFYNKLLPFIFLLISFSIYSLEKKNLLNDKKKFMFLSFPIFSVIIPTSLFIFCLF